MRMVGFGGEVVRFARLGGVGLGARGGCKTPRGNGSVFVVVDHVRGGADHRRRFPQGGARLVPPVHRGLVGRLGLEGLGVPRRIVRLLLVVPDHVVGHRPGRVLPPHLHGSYGVGGDVGAEHEPDAAVHVVLENHLHALNAVLVGRHVLNVRHDVVARSFQADCHAVGHRVRSREACAEQRLLLVRHYAVHLHLQVRVAVRAPAGAHHRVGLAACAGCHQLLDEPVGEGFSTRVEQHILQRLAVNVLDLVASALWR
mmetsp:Transcript_20455/g.38899  ORF Transcript_20455/g.38899 Transcript_20455/m.38899 type:complete len:256 (-) Transcript_20455:590-1357(-)